MKFFGFFKHKRVQGILLWTLSGILGAKGVLDPATAAIGKDLGVGLAGLGFVHAQEKKAKV